MKKIIIAVFLLWGTSTVNSFASSLAEDDINKVEQLSNDKNFLNYYNSLFAFSNRLYKTNATELFSKFVQANASQSEINQLLVKMNIASVDEIKAELTLQDNNLNSFEKNNSFLKEENGKDILKKALIKAVKNGGIKYFSKLPADCLESFMLGSALCWVTAEYCNSQGGDEWTCTGLLAACFSSLYNAYDKCNGFFQW